MHLLFAENVTVKVMLPAILLRGDKLNEKEETVNKSPKIYISRKICFLEYRNFNAKYHPSRSKLLSN